MADDTCVTYRCIVMSGAISYHTRKVFLVTDGFFRVVCEKRGTEK